MAQDPAPFWTREVLSGLSFNDNRDLYDHLKIEALRAGFDIASRQPLRAPYGVFYCTKGEGQNGTRLANLGVLLASKLRWGLTGQRTFE